MEFINNFLHLLLKILRPHWALWVLSISRYRGSTDKTINRQPGSLLPWNFSVCIKQRPSPGVGRASQESETKLRSICRASPRAPLWHRCRSAFPWLSRQKASNLQRSTEQLLVHILAATQHLQPRLATFPANPRINPATFTRLKDTDVPSGAKLWHLFSSSISNHLKIIANISSTLFSCKQVSPLFI